MSLTEERTAKYIVVCVNEFAAAKNINRRASFLYLYHFKGIHFLSEHYEIEHTLSFAEVIEDLSLVCRRNGGAIE